MCQQLLEQVFGNELRISRNFASALCDELGAVDGTRDGHFDNNSIFPSAILDDAAINPNGLGSHRLDFSDMGKAYRRHTMCGHIPIAHVRHSPALHQRWYLAAPYARMTRTILSARENSLMRRDIVSQSDTKGISLSAAFDRRRDQNVDCAYRCAHSDRTSTQSSREGCINQSLTSRIAASSSIEIARSSRGNSSIATGAAA